MDSLAEHISLTKFVAFEDISGLYELAERTELSTRTMQQLSRAASEREPTDEAFQLIVGELVGARTPEPDGRTLGAPWKTEWAGSFRTANRTAGRHWWRF